MQSLLGFMSVIFDIKRICFLFLIGCCPHRQSNNNCPEEIGDKKKLETLPTLVLASLHWKVPRFILKDAQQYCSYSDTAQSNIKVMSNGNDTWFVQQILITSTTRNVQRTVWRICMLILGFKGLLQYLLWNWL